MTSLLQFVSDVLAMLNTQEGARVIADLEAIAGITPPPTPTPTLPHIGPFVNTPIVGEGLTKH